MSWVLHSSKKVSTLVFGALILSAILSVAAESVPSLSNEVYAVMKHTKKMTLVSIKNQSDDPIYAVVLENPDDAIRFVKARGWDRERIDAGKVMVNTSDRPVMPGNNLLILLIAQTPPALVWATTDQVGNILTSGTVIERSTNEGIELEGPVVEGEEESSQPPISTQGVFTISTQTASFTHNVGSSCPQYIETVIIESNESISLEVVEKPDWLTLQVNETELLLYYNCPQGAASTLSGDIPLIIKNPEGEIVYTVSINVTGQVNEVSPSPPPEVQVSVNTTEVSFTHDMGQSSCPQYIETVIIESNESISLEVVEKPDWLTLQVNETELLLYYNCPSGQGAGALSGMIVLLLKSEDRVVDTSNININGKVNPIVASQEDPFQEKTHTLSTDGGIIGITKITCWGYGQEGQKIQIRIDLYHGYHNKGKNLMSAFIADLTKNGPNSYIEIGHARIPHVDYDYVAFTGLFDSKHFPATPNNNPCPIGDVGRIVVVIGTSPPSDEDTLSEGGVDIVAASTSGTTETGVL